MVNSCVAESEQTYKEFFKETTISVHKETNSKFKFLISLFSIKQIGTVSAVFGEEYFEAIVSGEYKAHYNQYFSKDSGALVCCEKMKNGAICQNVPIKYTECETNLQPQSCEYFKNCEQVCCYDSEEGLCYPNSPSGICKEAGGKSISGANCNNDECLQGCCILGEKTEYTTEKRCQYLSALSGYQYTNFKKGLNQIDCIKKQREQKTGACITKLGTCTFGDEASCVQINGWFHPEKLCSHPDFESSLCIQQTSVGCVDGKDEIYWFDSCGNRENIYSSNKNASWNGGFILKKEESCSPFNPNIDSNICGNCNRELGSVCSSSTKSKIQDGNFVCKSLNCIDERGNKRLNGESWCVYDGVIGTGDDLVGSRHWKRICQEGEIIVEPCADYRQEVCAEGSKKNSAGDDVSYATCRTNRWRNCITVNSMQSSEEEKKSLCAGDSDCFWKQVIVGDNDFFYCLPQYPPGFDFWNKDGGAKDICAIASQTCTYVKDCHGCVANCDCKKEIHTQRMNDFCTSLGDCGGYFNYKIQEVYDDKESRKPGEPIAIGWDTYTDGGYEIKGAPRIVSGLGCKGVHWGEILEKKLKNLHGYFPQLGSTADYGYTPWDERKGSHVGGSGKSVGFWKAVFSPVAIAAEVVAALAVLTFFGPVGWAIAAAIAVVAIIAGVFGKCKVKKRKITFTCLPWTAPTREQSCEICNDDPLKPCSEYRCKSLGASCQILNENSENPICQEMNRGDKVPPKIEFGEIDGGYVASKTENGVEIKTNEGGCIPEFTPVFFTINTDEYATCKAHLNEHTTSYDEMESYFGESNFYLMEHKGVYVMPSLDSFFGEFETSEERSEFIEKMKNMDMYIRCQDSHGNANAKEYVVRFCIKNGPDLTPPIIIGSNPSKESYVKHGEKQIDLTVYLNEPAECKFSNSPNDDYFSMKNSFECETDIEDYTEKGWECRTNMDISEADESRIYIKCRDQPWLELEEYRDLVLEGRTRNVNVEDYLFSVKKSKTKLSIDEVYPSGIIENGIEPVTIQLSAKTSGGARGNGNAVCMYIFEENGWIAQFQESGTNQHRQREFSLGAGKYEMRVECFDEAGNLAEGNTSFKIELDTTPPKITHVFRKGSNLEIQTDENARCYVGYESCMFDIEEKYLVGGHASKVHTIPWERGKRHYIRCEDVWGNKNSVCDRIISPDFF